MRILIILMSLCLSGSINAQSKVRYDIWHLVEGYRLGFISNFGQQAVNELWNYEGELNLGTATSSGPIYDRGCMEQHEEAAKDIADSAQREVFLQAAREKCFLTEEPWPFSTTNGDFLRFWNSSKVAPVLVYYVHPIWTPYQYFTKTKDYVIGIYPIDPNIHIAEKYVSKQNLYLGAVTNYEHKTIDGRIVKATLEHLIRKTYEVIIEEGLYGNSFIAMSVDDTDLFDYILKAMMTGKLLRIEYVRFWNWEGAVPSAIFNYNTYYRILSVEVTNVGYPQPPGAAPLPHQ